MKLRNVFYKLIVVLLIIQSIMYLSVVKADDDSQDVNISITPRPKLDIILSKARTKTDVTNFETDIKAALNSKGIDSSDVQVSSISAEKVNMETAFSWQSDVSSSIGSLSITNNGQNVVMYGNSSNPGKNAIWIEPDGNQEQKFSFNYSINFGDSFNAAGMLLRVKETNKSSHTLSGYMLSFNNSNWNSAAGGYNGAIWKFVYDGNNSSNMTKTLVRGLSISTSGTLSVNATDAEITISGGGLSSPVTCEIDENYTTGNGFGFFSDHYSHNCSNIGSFSLTGINLTAVTTKSFKEVLQLPEWRDEAERFLVNIDDYANDELDDSSAYSELLTKLMNESIYYVAWGNSKNATQFRNLVASNDNKGIFINNTSYSSSIEATAEYIESIVGSLKQSTQYVVVNSPIDVSVSPASIMNNTIDEEWPYGKWRINHDYTYYENNLGQFSESGKLINGLITTFDKTGKYEIYYRDKIVSPNEIFVHRKPVAQINIQRSGSNITLESDSYDLDMISSENKGISEEEWKYKTSDTTTWTEGKLTEIDTSKDYTVSLRVKDNQETWSDTATVYITSNASSKPVSQFNIEESTITKYEQLKVNDSSYDPAGGALSTYLWEVYLGDTKVYSGSTPKTDYSANATGEYTMYLTVTNAAGKTSDKFGRKFVVTNDETAPEIILDPMTCDWKKSQDVNITLTDVGGSNVKNYKYAITDSQSTPTQWSDLIEKSEDTITIDGNGEKYLHVIATDNAGNSSEDRVVGPYKIDNTEPIISVTGDFINEALNELEVNIKTTDPMSGVKTVTLDGAEITDDETITFNKNGVHTVIAEDNLGNTSSETITITNIYYECGKPLDHPHYSSDSDTCPICDTYDGLEVTSSEKVYNRSAQGVSYNNPKGAEIYEYYKLANDETSMYVNEQPTNVGVYDYELRVKYNDIEYKTELTGEFEITSKPISDETISTSLAQTSYIYDGTAKEPAVTTLDGTHELVQGTEYEVEYLNNVDKGTATAKVTGIGNYTGEVEKTYEIGSKSLTSEDISITLSQTEYTYNSDEKIPEITVVDVDKTLVENTDYTLEYEDNTEVGTAKVTITGIGNYSDEVEKTYEIGSKSLTSEDISITLSQTEYTYNSDEKIPEITVVDVDKTLVENTDYTLEYEDNTEAGTAKVTVTGIGNYSGEVEKTYTINPKSFESEDIEMELLDDEFEYCAEENKAGIQITDGIDVLSDEIDYTVSYTNNVNVGTATVTVTGTGNYTGTLEQTYTIIPKDLNSNDINAELDKISFLYTGTEKEPEPTVMFEDITLVKGTDYTVVYEDNISAGDAKAIITGIGNYTGEIELEFSIGTRDIRTADVEVTLTPTDYIYNGDEKEPLVTVVDGTKKLEEDKDFMVVYSNNINVGTATVTVTGIGDYAEDIEKTYTIHPKEILSEDIEISLSQVEYMYDSDEKLPDVNVKDNGKELVKDTDYTVSYTNNVDVGTATITITGIGNYTETAEKTYTIIPKDAQSEDIAISLDADNFVYDGTAKEPTVIIKDKTKDLIIGTDYDVTYQNNINVGTATAVATFKGNYEGTRSIEYTIIKCDPEYIALEFDKIPYWYKLKEIELPKGYTFDDPEDTSVGKAGVHIFEATYVPEDTDNYNIITGIGIKVTVIDVNIDIDGDGIPDINVDTDGDGIPDENTDESIEEKEVEIDTNDEDMQYSTESYVASHKYVVGGLSIYSKTYLFGEKYMEEIQPKTTVEALKSWCVTNGEIHVYDKGGLVEKKDTDPVGTGMIVKFSRNDEEVTFVASVEGDTTGDGYVTTTDLAEVQFHILNKKNLGLEAFRAADINRNKIVTGEDIATMRRSLLIADSVIVNPDYKKTEKVEEDVEENSEETKQENETNDEITDESKEETINETREEKTDSENTEDPENVENTEDKEIKEDTKPSEDSNVEGTTSGDGSESSAGSN